MQSLFGVFVLLQVCRPMAIAQEGPSPLAGKIVHVYNPFGTLVPLIDLSGAGHAMTADSGNWYRFDFDSLGVGLRSWMKDFGIRNNNWQMLNPTGIGGTPGFFGAEVFGASNEIWIMVDPSGPATAAPLILTTAPQTLRLLKARRPGARDKIPQPGIGQWRFFQAWPGQPDLDGRIRFPR